MKSTTNLQQRIDSPLTDGDGNFDALSYIQNKIEVLVEKVGDDIDLQSYLRVKLLVDSLMKGRFIDEKLGESLLEKKDFNAFSKKDYQDLLATFSKRPSGMKAPFWQRGTKLLEKLIKEAD